MKVALGYFWITLESLRSTLDHVGFTLGSLWAKLKVHMNILGDFRSPKVARATNSQAGGSAGRVQGGCEEGAGRVQGGLEYGAAGNIQSAMVPGERG